MSIEVRFSSLPWLLVALAVAGCGGGSGFSGPDDGGGTGSGDLRPGLTVRVEVDSGSVSLAQRLGWTTGVPGAEVRLHRLGTEFKWETALTDENGEARFPNVIAGFYRVAGYRALSAGEVARTGGAARAFGDGTHVQVGDGTEATLRLRADDPGSLVFSEIYGVAPFTAEVNYDFHYFLELYNNGDRTVFLDGMLVGTNFPMRNRELPDIDFACVRTQPWRDDPDGLWVEFIHRFPGTGSEHPVTPGQTVLVALDAVDHSQVDGRFPDLRQADFEFFGPADVDNPAVPNMPEVGIRPWFQGHGLRFFIRHNFFLARPVDVAGLPHRVYHNSGAGDIEFVRIPADALIDVVATAPNNALQERQFPPCPGARLPSEFDALEGGFTTGGVDLLYSAQRIPIGTVDGRVILQDTNTSAVDFMRALYTPGRLP
ncbi:MAG: hypothetical protein ACE5HQ_12255 [Gemmatimonadota bacterium]